MVGRKGPSRFVKPDLWLKIEKDIPFGDTSGFMVLHAVVLHMQSVTSSAVRKLVKKLEVMSLDKDPGKNVLDFGDKVLEVARRISRTGMTPRDLPLVIAARFLNCESFPFKLELSQIRREADQVGSMWSYEEIVKEHKNHDLSLLAQELWPGIRKESKSEENEILGLKAQIKSLQKAMGGGKPAEKG